MPIVEGDGDVQAVPILLRRICGEIYARWDITIRQPGRLPRSKIVIPAEIGRVYRALARGAVAGSGAVITILDQDDDMDISALAAAVAAPMDRQAPLEVVVACREFEAWFLGSMESLRAHHSVRNDARFDGHPEHPRDATGRVEGLMLESYRETLHQPAFARLMTFATARQRCPSFEFLVQAVGGLIRSE